MRVLVLGFEVLFAAGDRLAMDFEFLIVGEALEQVLADFGQRRHARQVIDDQGDDLLVLLDLQLGLLVHLGRHDQVLLHFEDDQRLRNDEKEKQNEDQILQIQIFIFDKPFHSRSRA